MSRVCRLAGMTRQNYYARRQDRQRHEIDVGLVLELVRYHRGFHPRIGGAKLHILINPELKEAGIKMGRDRLFFELRMAELLVEPRKSAWPKTTHFKPNLPVFRNRIKKLKPYRINQVWVSDITYIRTLEGFKYLSLITDKYSRKIVGFYLGCTLEGSGPRKALEKALKGYKGEKLIHHSDRGCQYASHAYVNRLKAEGILMSMTETDHCAENAMAERVNGILKQEYYLDREFATKSEAWKAIIQAIQCYNERRPHQKLGMRTPEAVHSLAE